ncbi:hypothetical protein O181_084444 [Austropuccinia psidii MF-1]|uniref:Chromo domain-containing protein n=1 Tax=Austropuccinia psidii MF-1 TaxID=1389203 RepID=A0A9Q3FTG5_9BASI|nr:hypothetical protein [Austropuccinia psidii MF-1]
MKLPTQLLRGQVVGILEWSSDCRHVHPVFHVSILEPFKQSTIPKQHQFPPPPAVVEEKEEWEVAQALEAKLKRGKLWYLVEWKGFRKDPERSACEPFSNLAD